MYFKPSYVFNFLPVMYLFTLYIYILAASYVSLHFGRVAVMYIRAEWMHNIHLSLDMAR